jgi:hypothetical protein
MDTPSEVNTQRQAAEQTRQTREAQRADRHRKRERAFEETLGLLASRLVHVGMVVYKAIEDIKGRVERMEVNLTALEETLIALEEQDSAIATGVRVAGERFTELAEELEGLQPGGTIEQSKIDALETKAKAVLDGLTQAGSELTQETPGAVQAKLSKTGYVFNAEEGKNQPDSRFTTSGFKTKPATGEPVPVLVFSGDVTATDTKGASVPGYSVYTGEIQAA